MADKKVILTGLRANNALHIGNYFGALLPIVDMAKKNADEYQINLFIPDLHSFTTPIDHSQLQNQIEEAIKYFIAAGIPIDHPNVNIYRQSKVSAHSELAWILSCFTGMGQLERMTQFKDKSSKLSHDSISVGLFNYPVLMAADILLYDAEYVPVGDDQSQHLEFTRDLAMKFNNKFGDILIIPKDVKSQHEFFNKDQGLRIKDLQKPGKKMSKSEQSDKGVIFLSDSPDVAKKKIKSTETDSLGKISYDPKNQPGISNLIDIYALVTNSSKDQIIEKYGGQTRYGQLKEDLATEVSDFIEQLQKSVQKIDETRLHEILEQSEEGMAKKADKKLYEVQKAVGLR